MSQRHHDLVIIGTGSGNSIIGPEFDDLDIAIMERGVFGGTCLNVGCIPTKMFVYPSDIAEEAAHADRLGLSFTAPQVRWREIRDRIFGRIDQIPPAGEKYRRESPNVTVYAGTARFIGAKTLDTGAGDTVTADRIVVAAGGRPRLMDIEGLDQADPDRGIHTNDTIMRLDDLPERMIIIGGGYIGAEFAHVFDALGTEVTWLVRSDAILRFEDETVSGAFTALAQERFDLRRNAVPHKAVYDGAVWTLSCTSDEGDFDVSAPVVLLAVGREPNTDLLDVAAGGIATHPDGRIVVDEFQQTNVEGVYALGDISSDFELKHVANREGKTVRYNLAHPDAPRGTDHRVVPHAVFANPQIASFGKTEQELREAGTAYLVKVQKYGDVAYGWAMEDEVGLVKVLADPETRQLLGAHLMGYQASSLIQPLIQAAQFEQTVDAVAAEPYWIHPALSEVIENALLGLDEPQG